jgi:hypothetical protein
MRWTFHALSCRLAAPVVTGQVVRVDDIDSERPMLDDLAALEAHTSITAIAKDLLFGVGLLWIGFSMIILS